MTIKTQGAYFAAYYSQRDALFVTRVISAPRTHGRTRNPEKCYYFTHARTQTQTTKAKSSHNFNTKAMVTVTMMLLVSIIITCTLLGLTNASPDVLLKASWAARHTGSCSGAAMPTVSVACDNGDLLSLSSQSDSAGCHTTSLSGMTCQSSSTSAGLIHEHAFFRCVSSQQHDSTPTASILVHGETSDCLGRDDSDTIWAHAVQLKVYCPGFDEAVAPVGSCMADNYNWSGRRCEIGWSCGPGNCSPFNWTISDITTRAPIDCTAFEPSASPSSAPSLQPSISLWDDEDETFQTSNAPTWSPTAESTADAVDDPSFNTIGRTFAMAAVLVMFIGGICFMLRKHY